MADGSKWNELRELVRVRNLAFLREPEAIFWVFVFPLVLAAVLGFAFRSGSVPTSRVALVDTPAGRELAERLEAAGRIELELVPDAAEARRLLERAAVDALVTPAEGDGPPEIALDPGRAEADTARLRVLRALLLADDPELDAALEVAPVTETGSRYIDFLFPGLLGMNLMGAGMWGVGFGIADLRRKRFLKRLLVTPMRRSSFFLSFLINRAAFVVIEVAVLTAFASWVLGVPFRGNFLSFVALSIVGGLTFAGLGILVAARPRTIEGVSGLMNLVMMPMWLASGVFFSYERFPDALHPLLRLLPLTALNDGLRAVMLDGTSLLSLGPELLVQVVWCALAFGVGLRVFRWE